MKAGHQLDAIIALQIFGYKYEERFPGDHAGYYVRGNERIISEELPAFSTRIEDAWRLVHDARFRYWTITRVARRGGPDRYKAICMKSRSTQQASVTAPTAPMAICLAALESLSTLVS